MHHLIVVSTAATLLVGGLVGHAAGTDTERGYILGACISRGAIEGACVFSPPAGVSRVDVRIVDDLVNPIAGSMGQDLDGDGAIDTGIADFCGSILGASIVEGVDVVVIVHALGPPACPGTASTGTVVFEPA